MKMIFDRNIREFVLPHRLEYDAIVPHSGSPFSDRNWSIAFAMEQLACARQYGQYVTEMSAQLEMAKTRVVQSQHEDLCEAIQTISLGTNITLRTHFHGEGTWPTG